MIKIIDYKAGNAPSVMNALKYLGHNAEYAVVPEDLRNASCIILPGVGSAGATLLSLKESGISHELNDLVLNEKIPYMGICVGMQILFNHSEEEDSICLGWLKGNVVKFNSSLVRVPQMGWNRVTFNDNSPFKAEDAHFYFVNSYYAKPEDNENIWGLSMHGTEFTAAVKKYNIFGAQFHIEKSGIHGLKLLDGFVKLC